MENKTKYKNILHLYSFYWVFMRAEEGSLTKRCARLLTAFDPMFN